MSNIIFRRVKESDLDNVYVLLNQLKELDQDSIDKERAWKNFLKNTSANSIVGILDEKIVQKNFSYNADENKFKFKEYQDKIEKNLIDGIVEDVIIHLTY